MAEEYLGMERALEMIQAACRCHGAISSLELQTILNIAGGKFRKKKYPLGEDEYPGGSGLTE